MRYAMVNIEITTMLDGIEYKAYGNDIQIPLVLELELPGPARGRAELKLKLVPESAVPGKPKSLAEAEVFLRYVLEKWPDLTPEAIKKLAKSRNISLMTLRRAKTNLCIVSVKRGFPAKVIRWAYGTLRED